MTDSPMHLQCVCGWEATGTEEEVVAAATEHGALVHNMKPTRDEVMAMVVAEPAAAADQETPP